MIYGEGNLCSILSNAVLNIDQLNFKKASFPIYTQLQKKRTTYMHLL